MFYRIRLFLLLMASMALSGFGAERYAFQSGEPEWHGHDRTNFDGNRYPSTVELGGGGFTFGGGIQYFISEKVAIDTALDLTMGHVEVVGLVRLHPVRDLTLRELHRQLG